MLPSLKSIDQETFVAFCIIYWFAKDKTFNLITPKDNHWIKIYMDVKNLHLIQGLLRN